MKRDRQFEVLALATQREALTAGAVAQELEISRQMAHRLLSDLVTQGRLERTGAGRAVRYRQAGGLPFIRRYPRAVLAEDRVWAEVAKGCRAVGELPKSARSIMQYAFTEMLNNAIEHSAGHDVEVRLESAPGGLAFIITDDGKGLFANVRKVLRLPSNLVALQELSKGKLTTLPAGHTGEGIFFTSKAVRLFEVQSSGLKWTVDNVRGDTAVGSSAVQRGTLVRAEVARNPKKKLQQIFDEYTKDFAFVKTRIVIKLFTLGTRFISRSEARRVVANLQKWQSVVLDFAGVEEIGQGFADEIFRVWARAHPTVRLQEVSMSPPVAFVVKRARRA